MNLRPHPLRVGRGRPHGEGPVKNQIANEASELATSDLRPNGEIERGPKARLLERWQVVASLSHLRLALLQPEPHVHLAVHRRGGGEVLASKARAGSTRTPSCARCLRS
jgi:hypothetical protein